MSRSLIVKRLFDIVVACCGAILVSPILIVLSLLVWLINGRPVFFCQERPGRHGKLFTLYKFRTMKSAFDEQGQLLSDSKRLTRFGTFLRKTSLDELPELLNVLKGEMSLVGPRPLLSEYLSRYSKEQARRHNVRPGITGWAQIHGRNAISWDERFELDVWYVDNWNVFLDLTILLLTVKKVLKGEGVSAEDHATMPKFTGSNRGDTNIRQPYLS